jgi:hypothetical protein
MANLFSLHCQDTPVTLSVTSKPDIPIPTMTAQTVRPTLAPSPQVEHHIFNAAREVALNYARNFFWSSWHEWDAIDQNHYDPTSAFWNTLRPYGNCLGASTHIFYELRHALSTHSNPSVAAYSNTVKLMTSAQHAPPGQFYHGVIALCFDTHAIVIDHSINSTAFKAQLNSEYEMEPYVPLFSATGRERFSYFLQNEEYKLMLDSVDGGCPPTYYAEMDVDASVRQLVIPAALEMKPIKSQPGITMPARKYVSVRSLLDKEPELIAAVPVEGKFLAITLRVQADFASTSMLMQIPRADWLEKEQGAVWNDRLAYTPGFSLKCDASAHLKVDMMTAKSRDSMSETERQELEVMALLGEEFGLDRNVVFDMAASIYRAWAPHRVCDGASRTP